MSLITRCPACATHFKVVSDQLRVSQGWVRCGQCDEVFDANAHLKTPEGTTFPAKVEDPLDAPDNPEKYNWDGVLDVPGEPLAHTNPPHADDFLHKSPQELVNTPVFVEQQNHSADTQTSVAASTTSSTSNSATDPATTGVHEAPFFSKSLEHADEEPPISFLSRVDVDQNSRRVAARLPWGALLVVLGLILALQITLHERNRLAALYPAFIPTLAGLCVPLSCQVVAYQQIDAIVIESSAFSKALPEVFNLSFTLKNNGSLAVAMPSLELTLTDWQDQAVLRKVLSVHDMGRKAQLLSADEEFNVSLPVAVKQSDRLAKISGYRLLAFYP
jgi:predicted Zn finger-like uncharacterized protein